jgi:hydroxyethylthiazole kinase-like uncharacterized protein yjeF
VIPVVTPEQMRSIDGAASDPVEVLIERAGAAVARAAVEMLGGTYGRTVAVIAGPGNNGADGRVAAALLRARGMAVQVYEATRPIVLRRPVDLVIDAAFGTGFRGEWSPPEVGEARVLAVDIPTGLHALTGRVSGRVLVAERTVTFAAAKPGHVFGDGPDLVGELTVVDIGLEFDQPAVGIVTEHDVRQWLRPRRRTAHKWDHAVRVIAGSPGMDGAAVLAASAAQRAGAGMVVVSQPGGALAGPSRPIEAVRRELPDGGWSATVLADLDRFRALVIGPGIGRRGDVLAEVVQLVERAPVATVVDGDALAALASALEAAPGVVRDRPATTVVTPHDGEYARLVGESPGDDRVAAAVRLAHQLGCVVVLKGPATVIADAGGRALIVTAGDERLATAGTGDVLSGIIGAQLALGVPALEAAACATYVHAMAARRCPKQGVVAGDLLDVIPDVLTELVA